MAFETPALKDIIQRIRDNIEAKTRGVDPDTLAGYELRRGDPKVLASGFGAAVHGLYGQQNHISRQILTSTADAEMLALQGAELGIYRKQPTAASGLVVFTGDDGARAPAGTILRRTDDSERFIVQKQGVIASGSVSVEVLAEYTGQAGNTDAGESLTLVSPLLGIVNSATVGTEGLTGGADLESDEELRARILFRKQNPPKGGAASDYIQWALEVSGVTRAYAWENGLGPGTVTLAPLFDNNDSPIPGEDDVARVRDYINEVDENGNAVRRPCCCECTVFALTPVEQDFTIQITPATDAVKAAVEAELADLITRTAKPGGTLLLSHMQEAISIAAGETDHVLISPAANVTVESGELLVMGTITWD